MQCVRCQHPLPPRADRCLRCFALNPQNRPEPLASATPAQPLGAIKLKPLGLSFESDPPPKKAPLGGLSFDSEPPAQRSDSPLRAELETPAPQVGYAREMPVFTPLEADEAAFHADLAAPPRLVIDLNAAREPEIPDTKPSPPPSGMELTPRKQAVVVPPAELAQAAPMSMGPSMKITEPQLTPAPFIDLPPPPKARPPARDAARRSLDELAQQALLLSDPGLPLDLQSAPPLKSASTKPASASAASPDLAGFENPHRDFSAPLAPPVSSAPPPSMPPDLAGLDSLAPRDPRPPLRARLTAWALDFALIALVSALFVGLAALQLGGRKLAPLGAQSWESWLDGLLFARRLPIFWGLLWAAIAVGYSWLFAALGGRTPGQRAAGLRLLREDGTPLDPVQALLRAALALPSAALGLFGFVLALFDPRGQTLHDKLSGSLLVVSGEARRGSN